MYLAYNKRSFTGPLFLAFLAMVRSLYPPAPVSYTHLDVYKRQIGMETIIQH